MIKKFTFLLLFIFSFSSTIFGQKTPEDALQNFTDNFPQEKIHLMLNKKSFVAGESIFFKGMIIDGL